MTKKQTGIAWGIGIPLAVVIGWGITRFVENRNLRQETLQSEYARVVDNVYRTMAGSDGAIDSAEKRVFLTSLGWDGGIIDSTAIVRVEPVKGKIGFNSDFLFTVKLEQLTIGSLVKPADLGKIHKDKLEQYCNDHFQWIE